MAPEPTGRRDSGQMHCPTCRASQEWSDTCRRCKCDLRLLRAGASTYERHRRACVAALGDGDGLEAARQAARCHVLRPGPESRQLRALSALLRGDWRTAVHLGRG